VVCVIFRTSAVCSPIGRSKPAFAIVTRRTPPARCHRRHGTAA
jgi:hypothetical protein